MVDIESLSQKIKARGMASPAVFMLEMYKPLAGTIFNIGIAAFPLLTAVLGFKEYEAGLELMRSPELIEELIKRLEQ